jgi:hypothetical protein
MDIPLSSELEVVDQPRVAEATGGKHHQWRVYAIRRGNV